MTRFKDRAASASPLKDFRGFFSPIRFKNIWANWMHYFKRNIGDYAKKAGRLSMLQHGAYTLLLDACYDREQFPTIEQAIEWKWASTHEEEEAVRFVLRKFFTLEGDIYVQKRIQEEIAEWRARAWFPHDPRNPPTRPTIDEWKSIRDRIFQRDNYTCTYCGQHGGKLECDHIHPVSRGGTSDDANLATACKACNRSKGSMTVEEWRGKA